MSAFRLNIVTELTDASAEHFMSVAIKYIDEFMPDVLKVSIYEKPLHIKDASSWLRKSNRNSFNMEVGDWSFHAVAIGGFSIGVFYIENKRGAFDWDWWVSAVSSIISVRQALIVDADYDYWQNASDPLQYEAVSRRWQHLPAKSNELPPPLERTVIDTSGNPGRYTIQEGYIEAIGSVMWLSEGFLQQLNSSIERIAALHWAKVSPFANGLWRVQSAESPFSDDQGEIADRQNALRAVLYSAASG